MSFLFQLFTVSFLSLFSFSQQLWLRFGQKEKSYSLIFDETVHCAQKRNFRYCNVKKDKSFTLLHHTGNFSDNEHLVVDDLNCEDPTTCEEYFTHLGVTDNKGQLTILSSKDFMINNVKLNIDLKKPFPSKSRILTDKLVFDESSDLIALYRVSPSDFRIAHFYLTKLENFKNIFDKKVNGYSNKWKNAKIVSINIDGRNFSFDNISQPMTIAFPEKMSIIFENDEFDSYFEVQEGMYVLGSGLLTLTDIKAGKFKMVNMVKDSKIKKSITFLSSSNTGKSKKGI